ncbi:MAG: hypothetical protein LBR00_02120, partial [Clostridiales Family XIII bacterium]|nr:hypothetical protein [Clostridiales Family XIII bacterium]
MVGLEQNATLLIEAEQDIPGAMLYQRPRVWELFRKARMASLVMVVANAGCGKTTATYQYMMQLDAPVVWFRFKDSDNNPQQFWEDYTASVETQSERYADRLRMCGFPDSDEKFDMYMRIQKDELAGVGKLVVVCDDYHNIKNGAVVRFLEKSAYHGESCIKRVLISRTEPVFSILEFFVKGKIVHITESDLAFTKDEIAGYYRMLGINIPLESVTRVHEETGGWAFAVALVGRLLEKSGGELAPAQYAYKANIVQMIDLLVSESLSNNLYRLLLKLSLIDGRNAELVRDIAGSDETMNELNDMTVFVRFDRLLQVYEIHAVLLDYLRERQDELTAKEKKRVYHLASEWFMKEGQTLNAAKCYARCGEWEKVVMIAKEMPQEVPLSIAETFLSLLEDCPPETLDGIPDYFPLRVRLLFCTGDLEKAKAECIEMIERFSAMPKKKVVPCMLGHLYFQLGTIAMMQAPEAETYDFAQYYEEGGRRLEGTRLCTTGLQNIWHIGAHSLLVGTERAGAVEEFLEQLKAIDAYSDNEFNGRISGLYELTLGEYCYYKGDMEQTLALARMAYQQAIESDQTIIQNRAIIGRVFAATALGDYEAIMRAKVDLDTQHEKRDSLYRTASYDVAYSSWCSAIGRPQDAAEWL